MGLREGVRIMGETERDVVRQKPGPKLRSPNDQKKKGKTGGVVLGENCGGNGWNISKPGTALFLANGIGSSRAEVII